jgi:hypothetical protein
MQTTLLGEHYTGVTQIGDAAILLENTPGVTVINGLYVSSSGITELSWRFGNTTDSGQATTGTQNKVILMFGFNTYSDLKLTDVVSAYGFPTRVRVYGCSARGGKHCSVDLIYDPEGMALELYLNDKGAEEGRLHSVKIDPDIEVGRIRFFPSNQYVETLENFVSMDLEDLTEWVGYTTYYQGWSK